MDFLLKQDIDKNNFNIFIRDLSLSLNANLKHIIEDSLKLNASITTNLPTKHHKGRKPVVKKKDIIIAEQNQKRELLKIQTSE
jgi:hypothetical protein